MLRPGAVGSGKEPIREPGQTDLPPPPSAYRKAHSSSAAHSALGISVLQVIRFLLELFLLWALVHVIQQNEENRARIPELKSALARSEAHVQMLEINVKRAEADSETRIRSQIVTTSGEFETKYREASENLSILQKRIETLESQARGRNKALERMQRYLRDTMQDLCEREFSESPAHILVDTSEGEIEIEMAPCDVMPVVTMHFIQQVRDGFWDGMSFFRAESHVIQATNMAPDGTHPTKQSIIKRSSSIPFQEYADKYPHNKFTLGIAGRPGGPDFYINMLDNKKIHGPGGQGHNYQGDPDADSCFAHIVRGEDVALRIQKLAFKRQGGLHILVHPVEIKSMRVVADES